MGRNVAFCPDILGRKGHEMFLLLFVLWVVFNAKINLEIILFGVVLTAAVYAFSCAFLGYSLKKDIAAFRRIPAALRYVGLLIAEIVKSNLALIRVVYSLDAEVHPQLVTFKTPLRGAAKSVLADSITVTPGTISVHSEGDTLTVHCLDRSFAEGIEETEFQKQLIEMQKEAEA